MKSAKNLLVLFILFIFICLFFGDQIFNKATLGLSYISGDQLYPYVAFRTFFINEIWQGHIGLWNPYWCFGFPSLGFQDLGLFYFLSVLYFIFSYQNAVVIFTVFHMLLGGFFTYLFARRIKISEFSSIISATIFMLCGFNMFFILMHHDVSHAAIAYIPAVFLAVYNLAENPSSLVHRIILTVLIGLQVSAGIGGFIFIIIELIGIAAFLFFLLFKKHKETGGIKKVFLTFLCVSIFISLGLLLNSAIILPCKEFFDNSAIKYGFCNEYRQWHEFIRLSDIAFFAAIPTYENKNYIFPGALNPHNFFYLGIIPLVLYFLSFFSNNRLKLFFCIILPLVSLIFVCGYYVPFFNLINFIPVLKNIRLFLRFYVLFVFAIAICSGLGLDFLSDKNLLKYESKKKLFIGICFVFYILIIIFYFKAQF